MSGKPRHLLIVSTARCKSTIIARLLANQHADLLIEPFTKVFYGAKIESTKNTLWPETINEGIDLIKKRVEEADFYQRPLVVKILAYQALYALMNTDFLNWLNSNFHIIYLIRQPRAIAHSIVNRLISDQASPDLFSSYIGLAELYSSALILKPDIIITVETDIDPDPIKFVHQCWKATDFPLAEEMNDFTLTTPTLSEKVRCGLHTWPSWFKRAIDSTTYQTEQRPIKEIPIEYRQIIEAHLPCMEFFVQKLLALRNLKI